ncbi:hypothetical protein HNV12_13905 [Methanococcoides sp. SA1]|nr:hypothetical protein [Methanococcoides sp. SA1]
MMNKQIKEQAQELYSQKEYSQALCVLLELGSDECVNYLKKGDNQWFTNTECCENLIHDDSLLKKMLELDRADEILYTHFNYAWKDSEANIAIAFQSKIAEVNPDLFVKAVRVTQAFVKSPWCNEYSKLKLPLHLSAHQKVWKHIQETEFEIWNEVDRSLLALLSSGLKIEEILVEVVIAIELRYSNDMNNATTQHLARSYSVFIQLLFSKFPTNFKIPTPTQDEMSSVFKSRLKSHSDIAPKVECLLSAILNWIKLVNTEIDPYSFDLKITPKEELGIVSFNRDSLDYYKWELDGKRYEINKIDYLKDAQKLFEKSFNDGVFSFPSDVTLSEIEYEKQCQTQMHALNEFMEELTLTKFPGGNNLNSVRYFEPLIAASNMFAAISNSQLYSNINKSNDWFTAFSRMFKHTPSHLGISNFPFLYLKPKDLYDAHDSQSKIEGDENTSAKTLCKPFTYKPSVGKRIDRFNLDYDVFKKPFLEFGQYIFCPIHFLVNNDWFYSISQTALERLDNVSNKKLRKETAKKMENNLEKYFIKAGFEAETFEGHEFTNEEGDIDVKVTDGKDTILIQLKRTKMRFNLKDAYFEYINTDRKASRQINKVQKYFDSDPGTKYKWVVTNSYENVYTEIDGCLKVNYLDLVTILKSFANIKETSISDLVDRITSDSQVRDVLDYKHVLEPEKLDLFSYVSFKKSDKFKVLHPFSENFQIYQSINIPLPVVEPKAYRETSFAVNLDSTDFLRNYNEALEADRNGNLDLAHQLLENCLIENPNDFDTLGAFANVLANLKKYDEAFNMFEKALKLCPNDLFVSRNYAIALLENGGKEKALKVSEQLKRDYWFVDLQIFNPVCNIPPKVLERLLQ